jgi:restriction system protein
MENAIFLFLIAFFASIILKTESKKKYRKYNKKNPYTFNELIKNIKNNIPKNQNIYETKNYDAKEYFFKDTFTDIGKNNPTYNQESAFEKERKKAFEENRRKRAREHYISTEKKGNEYELFVAKHFEVLGYKVKNHGLIHGRKDSSIDVIAMKDKEITLIQCKNWKENSKYKITHEKIKAFIGDTEEFLNKNKDKAAGYTIKRLYVTSNDILDSSARYFLKDSGLVEHIILPIEA